MTQARVVIGAWALAAMLVGCAAGGAGGGSGTNAIRGTVFLNANSDIHAISGGPTDGAPCAGAGGYVDLAAGAQVTVADQANKIVATGQLQSGRVVNVNRGERYGCTFEFTTSTVPRTRFYQVTVGRRPPVTYSDADIVANGWALSLTIGS